jgi:hypothetical protein
VKLNKITVGGRRSMPNYEHVTAEVEISVEDGEVIADALAEISNTLDLALSAAVVSVHGNTARPATPATAITGANPKPAVKAPAPAPKPAETKPAPAVKAKPENGVVPFPAAKPADERMTKRVAACREIMATKEVAETELIAAAGVSSLIELPGLNKPCTKTEIEQMVDSLVLIMKNSDQVPV